MLRLNFVAVIVIFQKGIIVSFSVNSVTLSASSSLSIVPYFFLTPTSSNICISPNSLKMTDWAAVMNAAAAPFLGAAPSQPSSFGQKPTTSQTQSQTHSQSH